MTPPTGKHDVFTLMTAGIALAVVFLIGTAFLHINQSLTNSQQPVVHDEVATTTPSNSNTDDAEDKQNVANAQEAADSAKNQADENPNSQPPNYVEVIDSCGSSYEEDCLVARADTATSSRVITRLRNGVVLPIEDTIEANEQTWYQVTFREWVRYPNRLDDTFYIAADYVRPFYATSSLNIENQENATSSQRIVVDLSEQMLYAYEANGDLFMKNAVSTGKYGTPTPRGRFPIFKKTPSRYMQGPLPGITSQYYDLPGVPWNLYFTYQGAVIHGAYWHDSFGQVWSHGCVNLPPAQAQKLYNWVDLAAIVHVRD